MEWIRWHRLIAKWPNALYLVVLVYVIGGPAWVVFRWVSLRSTSSEQALVIFNTSWTSILWHIAIPLYLAPLFVVGSSFALFVGFTSREETFWMRLGLLGVGVVGIPVGAYGVYHYAYAEPVADQVLIDRNEAAVTVTRNFMIRAEEAIVPFQAIDYVKFERGTREESVGTGAATVTVTVSYGRVTLVTHNGEEVLVDQDGVDAQRDLAGLLGREVDRPVRER